jgi:diadenosine tetraphosphate (Ap4A) HIT family hydrolase
MKTAGCPLCETEGGVPVFRGQAFRVIRAEEADHPAFYRLVWGAHVAEFSDLSAAQRTLCMEAVACMEQVLRQRLAPDKINLAALGNMVPHLHWHVIARFAWDRHFPAPVWATPQRAADVSALARVRAELPALDEDIRRALTSLAQSRG